MRPIVSPNEGDQLSNLHMYRGRRLKVYRRELQISKAKVMRPIIRIYKEPSKSYLCRSKTHGLREFYHSIPSQRQV